MNKPKVFDYRKFEFKRDSVLVDPRNHFEKFKDKIRSPKASVTIFGLSAFAVYAHPWFSYIADVFLFYNGLYFLWLTKSPAQELMPFRMPKSAKKIDPNYRAPGTNKPRQADGILYLGNEERTNEEIWFTNTDARTHILYLGTTGSGKTEGLKSLASNAMGWGSGFIYVDGKADTDLWGSLSAIARRFGRDDDLLVLNYMSGNSDARTASNTVNPFAQGSASYLTNLLVSLMPEVQGDNAMWKDRAVALLSALMPVLTWQRTNQEKALNITTIRDSLNFKRVVELTRRPEIPERFRKGLKGYLDTLPGYTDAGFNDDGTEKPNPSGGQMDYSTIYQQHGYLAMQFTRQLQSLADDYGYIFEAADADIDMMDVVLNRRILVVLIPALEKSADETANLGKIVGSMLKGMMGATLGSTVEGDTDAALENKPTRSSTPFMAIFDEVGYYTTQGMAVMAAQARSLGFCLVFAGQDLPALEKRVKEEARSITANCNIKIFGKLEDPTQTKEFFEKTVGEAAVVESSSRKEVKALFGQKRLDKTDSVNVTTRAKASYSQLKDFKEGQSIVTFGSHVVQARMFYSEPGKIRSLRVNRFVALPHPDPNGRLASKDVDAVLERMRNTKWTARNAETGEIQDVFHVVAEKFHYARQHKWFFIEAGCIAVTHFALANDYLTNDPLKSEVAKTETAPDPVPEPQTSPAADEAGVLNPPIASPGSAAGDEGTISWGALVDEPATAQASPPSSPVVGNSEDIPQGGIPDTSETISWRNLVAEENPPSSAAPPASSPASSLGQMPLGGFGLSSYGTSFGHGGSGGYQGPLPSEVPSSSPPPATKISPASSPDSGGESLPNADKTVNWKDLIE